MTQAETPRMEPGRNIAMKIPSHEFAATVTFYRDVVRLKELTTGSDIVFEFGDKRLWLDDVSGLSQAEIWLELRAEDTEAAARYFESQGITRCDAIEALPDGFDGFWISSPANIIHLVSSD